MKFYMSKDPREFLRHIKDECSYILSVTEDLTFDTYNNVIVWDVAKDKITELNKHISAIL